MSHDLLFLLLLLLLLLCNQDFCLVLFCSATQNVGHELIRIPIGYLCAMQVCQPGDVKGILHVAPGSVIVALCKNDDVLSFTSSVASRSVTR